MNSTQTQTQTQTQTHNQTQTQTANPDFSNDHASDKWLPGCPCIVYISEAFVQMLGGTNKDDYVGRCVRSVWVVWRTSVRAHTAPLWDCSVEAHECVHSEAAHMAYVHEYMSCPLQSSLRLCGAEQNVLHLGEEEQNSLRLRGAEQNVLRLVEAESHQQGADDHVTLTDYRHASVARQEWSNTALADVVKVPHQFALRRVANRHGDLVYCVATIGMCAHATRAHGLR